MAQQQSSGPVKPTLLAFHGSGSNALCHTIQLARLTRVIKDHVNIESLQAPFPSAAGPGILPYFDDCGPFFRWLPPSQTASISAMRDGTSTHLMPPEVVSLIKSTVESLRAKGSRVIGVIGFSQGTKIVAGLLRASELRATYNIPDHDWCDFAFGISVCDSYPPGLVPEEVLKLVPEGKGEGRIARPTMHVLGGKDEWMWAGEAMVEKEYEVKEGGSTVLVCEDMGHVYPMGEDCERVGRWVVEVLGKVV
ncbi:hypothetical protein CC86DRAFT_46276 [Ophiobolus disseminans]|uniref:Serine hydrolase domain-containing protein n=1 Tax=Ophiobolus disseminans TaxID=1469910 RepID=A0A6A6ZVH7_9PLEO|nr:hypothetical protein CC86DRAFT_46276 [Ophiobolus disseminans]